MNLLCLFIKEDEDLFKEEDEDMKKLIKMMNIFNPNYEYYLILIKKYFKKVSIFLIKK
jgi:hypothetical protein